MSRRRRPGGTRTLVVPPPRPLAEQHRAVIGSHTLRAGLDAHQGSEHAGQVGRDCRTCARYSAALAAARGREREPGDGEAFEVPTSAANAYATAVRPHVGGPVTSPSPAPPEQGATRP